MGPSDRLVIVSLEIFDVILDHLKNRVAFVVARKFGLNEETFLEILGGDSGRVEVLNHLKHKRSIIAMQSHLIGEIINGQIRGARTIRALNALQIEIPAIVEVTDH